jgi:anti-sigma factor RsiW
MNEHIPRYTADHGAVIALLPWYANGSLRHSERLKVRAHLESCARCRNELAEFQQLQSHWQHLALGEAQVEAGLAQLMDRIERSEHAEAEAAAPGVSSRGSENVKGPAGGLRNGSGLGEWLGGLLRFPKPMLAFASVAGAMLLALVTAPRLGFWDAPKAYHTLGLPSASKASGSRDLQLVFVPSATVQQVMELVVSINGRIVDGPTEPGVFTVRLNDTDIGEHEVLNVVERLRDSPLIMMVEPEAPPASQAH